MKRSAIPVTNDGRNVDPSIGRLEGEASTILSRNPVKAASLGEATLASIVTPADASTTYYVQPVLKAPVWKAYIPLYFFVGGLASGAMVIGASAQLLGGKRLRRVVMPARWLGIAGSVASAALLVADLGRPTRFLYMLRVFRPTSPMNLGAWILTGAGAAASISAVSPYTKRRSRAHTVAEASGLVAGVFGLGLATYAGVLIANTAVPAWQYGSRSLPPLFAASSAASAAAALEAVPNLGRHAGTVIDVVGAIGKAAELAGGLLYRRELAAKSPRLAKHLTRGRAGTLLRTSQVLTLTSLAASLLERRRISSVLGLAGALALRFAVMAAGRASALDPRATFEPQRST